MKKKGIWACWHPWIKGGKDGKKLSITVDSGAVDHVTTKKVGDKLGTTETEASKKGMHYRAANGSQIKNHGACEAKGKTDEGTEVEMKFQVADVTKTLGSVRRMTQAGNRVVFDANGSYIENKRTGAKTKIHDETGEFKVDMWILQEEDGSGEGELATVNEETSVFSRLEDLI